MTEHPAPRFLATIPGIEIDPRCRYYFEPPRRSISQAGDENSSKGSASTVDNESRSHRQPISFWVFENIRPPLRIYVRSTAMKKQTTTQTEADKTREGPGKPAVTSGPESQLCESDALISRRDDGENKTPTPLPKQIYVILIICLAEPVTATVIYPFIIELINSLGVTNGDDSKVGYYAGMIESIFFLTETCLIFHYGRLSDTVGRRPVILLGLFGLALSIVSFGLSRTFVGLVVSRALSGALNGNAGVIKSIVAELTDSSNQAQGFALVSVMWYVGSTVGPLIGGSLSKPAERFPGVFGSKNHTWAKLGMKGFWTDYPYFLPCFMAGIVAACAWCVALIFLRETLPAKRIQLVRKATSEYGTITWDTERAPQEDPCPLDGFKAVLTPRVGWAIGNFMLLALVDVAWIVLQPLVFATHRSNGGLSLSPQTIGYILAVQGLIGGAFQATMFQGIYARFGAIKVYRAALVSYAFMFVSFIWLVELGLEGWMGWLVLGAHIATSCIAVLGFSCTFILISAAAPSRALLGTTNGLAQTSCSLIRALGPAGASSLFAYSSGVGGTLIYWVCVGVVGLTGLASLGLTE